MHYVRQGIKILVVIFVFISLTSGAAGASPVANSSDPLDCEFPLTAEDATDTTVEVTEQPERIVTLQPSSTQIAWEIGAWDRVVGAPVGPYIDYLAGYDDPSDISMADDLTPNIEEIIALEPDLVVAAGVQDDEQIKQLRDAGLTVFKFSTPTSFDALYAEIYLMGQLSGSCDGAVETVDWMQSEMSVVETAVDDEEQPTVAYLMGGGFTAGDGSFTDEIITTAGATNLATEVGIEFYDVLSEELLVQEEPDWIIYPDTFDEPPVDGDGVTETPAWENDNFIVLNASYLNQAGPRIVYPVSELAATLHSEAYEEPLDEARHPNPYAEDERNAASAEHVDEQPGFGVVIATIAALSMAFLRTRHR